MKNNSEKKNLTTLLLFIFCAYLQLIQVGAFSDYYAFSDLHGGKATPGLLAEISRENDSVLFGYFKDLVVSAGLHQSSIALALPEFKLCNLFFESYTNSYFKNYLQNSHGITSVFIQIHPLNISTQDDEYPHLIS